MISRKVSGNFEGIEIRVDKKHLAGAYMDHLIRVNAMTRDMSEEAKFT